MSDFPEPVVYQLKVVLQGISPMIWRRLLVPAVSVSVALAATVRLIERGFEVSVTLV